MASSEIDVEGRRPPRRASSGALHPRTNAASSRRSTPRFERKRLFSSDGEALSGGEMRRRVKRKTDFGVIVLHWVLTVTVLAAVTTGLRILDPGGQALGGLARWLLPADNIWPLHMWAGISLVAFAVTYPLYLRQSGLDGRIMLDRARFATLRGGGAAGRGAITVVVYWMLFALLAAEIGTGVVLYLGYGGTIVGIHRAATWGLLVLVAGHLASHFAFGGFGQLARVFRPTFDAAPSSPGRRSSDPEDACTPQRPSARRGSAIVAAAATAVAVVSACLGTDWASRDVLPVTRIAKSVAPAASDGLANPIWRRATPITVHTQQGANFGGSGVTVIEIRALHDADVAYFAFSWDDPTRSLKHMPLVKGDDGWHVLRRERDLDALGASNAGGGASDGRRADGAFAEDKLAVMLATGAKGFGPGAFHVGERPLADKPPSASGRGLHYRTDGRSAEVWLWHALGGPPWALCEHLQIGSPTKPTAKEVLGWAPYKGGIRPDDRARPFVENLQMVATAQADDVAVPLRLPRSLAEATGRLGAIDMRADRSEPDDARWSLTEADSVPYSAALDAAVPVGTVIPGAIVTVPSDGDGGDLRCAAHWTGGRWTLIVSRRLRAGRPGDVMLDDGAVLWVAAFDHDPAQHTRHMRPIRLSLR